MKKLFLATILCAVLIVTCSCSAGDLLHFGLGDEDQYVNTKELAWYYDDEEAEYVAYSNSPWRNEYSPDGDITFALSVDAQAEYFGCDENHNVITMEYYDSTYDVFESESYDQYKYENTYDADDNLISTLVQERYYDWLEDEYSQDEWEVKYEYDKKGRLIKWISTGDDWEVICEEKDMTYDKRGNVLTEVWHDMSTGNPLQKNKYIYVRLSEYNKQREIVEEVLHDLSGSEWKVVKGYDKEATISFDGDSLSGTNSSSDLSHYLENYERYKINSYKHIISFYDKDRDSDDYFYMAYFEHGKIYIWIPELWLLEYAGS